MPEEETARLEELRKQALTDYEREVSQHASKLEEMRELRTKLSETEERSRQAVAAAEEVCHKNLRKSWHVTSDVYRTDCSTFFCQGRSATAREAAAEAETKRLLESKVKDLEQKIRDLEERNSLLDQQLQLLDREKEARLSALAAGSPAKPVIPGAVGAAGAAGDEDADAEKQLRDMREHVRRLITKADLAEYRLLDSETELAREKQRAEQDRREMGELRARLEVEESRNSSALSSEQQFEKLREQVQTLSVFKESNAHLRAEAEEANSKLEKCQARLKEVEAQVMPLQQTIARLETKQNSMQSDVKHKTEELNRWKERATELQNKYGTAGVDPVEYEKVRGEVEKVKSQLAAASAASADASKSRDAAAKEAEELRKELRSVQESGKTAAKQLEEAKAAAAAAAASGDKEKQAALMSPEEIKQTETYKSYVQKVKDQHDNLINRIKKAKAEITAGKEVIEKNEQQIAALNAEMTGLKEAAASTLAAATAAAAPAAPAAAELQAEIAALKSQKEAAGKELAAALSAKDQAGRALAEAKANVQKLEQELAAEKSGRQEDAKKMNAKINTLLTQVCHELRPSP